MKTPHYFIRFKTNFESLPKAETDAKYLDERYGIGNLIHIGYHLPQPQYKSWVPLWLIRLIIVS